MRVIDTSPGQASVLQLQHAFVGILAVDIPQYSQGPLIVRFAVAQKDPVIARHHQEIFLLLRQVHRLRPRGIAVLVDRLRQMCKATEVEFGLQTGKLRSENHSEVFGRLFDRHEVTMIPMEMRLLRLAGVSSP